MSPKLANLARHEDALARNLVCVAALLTAFILVSPSPTPASARENLQSVVRSAMTGYRGAVIVSNPTTGEIMAIWNSPEAFDRVYPPGSTAKLVTAAAALEEGVISPNEQDSCHRIPELLGDAYHCSHPPPNGPFTLASAISNSCNYFFSALSLRLTPAQLAHWYSGFGFGSPVDGVGHGVAGRVRIGGTAREKALAALGEQTVLVTPAQLLSAYSVIATRGVDYGLRLAPKGGKGPRTIIRQLRLHPGTFELLNAALVECVESGTGHGAAVPGVAVAGKTGTATALDGTRTTHAWFVGYAPAERPEIALVIFLERGTGARDAAPLAGTILRHYFNWKDQSK